MGAAARARPRKRRHRARRRRQARRARLRAAGGGHEPMPSSARSWRDIPQLVPACFVGLAVDPAVLNARIDARVDAMFDAGLVDEVARLLQGGIPRWHHGPPGDRVQGGRRRPGRGDDDGGGRERIKTATHRYAKRQRTWFRKDGRIAWIDANGADAREAADERLHPVGDTFRSP
ncbi:MAG: tRNA dimethylallyltransferase [Gordonibacter pamelaeae]